MNNLILVYLEQGGEMFISLRLLNGAAVMVLGMSNFTINIFY
jgi:hypothetical protein